MLPANKIAREVQKLRGQNGHAFCTCLQPQSIMRKQSSRSSRRCTDENITTEWMIWTWRCFIEAFFRIPLFVQHSSWTSLWHVKNSQYEQCGIHCYSMKLENWAVNKKKSLMYAPWASKMLRGCSWLSEKAYRITNVKSYVFSNSVFHVGKMENDPVATWKRICFERKSHQRKETNVGQVWTWTLYKQ